MMLKDKRVLVIGGGSGIGFGIAQSAAKEGAQVLIASRDAKKIAEATQTIGASSAVIDLDLPKAAARLTTRFWGAVAVAKHGATKLPPDGSYTITNGMLAYRPMKGRPMVTVGACAVEGLALGLAVDLAPVRVNCVCPGLIDTELWDAFPEGYREGLAAMAQKQLVPRPGQPAEAAEACLTCMRNGFLTGQTIKIEGGIALAG